MSKINTELFPILENLDDLVITEGSKKKKYIVMHHSATEHGSAEGFHRYHVNTRGWRAMGYHFVIGNGVDIPDGFIQCNMARDFDHDWDITEETGAQAAGFNTVSIGICCVGHFDHKMPTYNQMISSRVLVNHLQNSIRNELGMSTIKVVIGHREVDDYGGSNVTKTCPGKMIHLEAMRNFYLSGQDIFMFAKDKYWYRQHIKRVMNMNPEYEVIFYGKTV